MSDTNLILSVKQKTVILEKTFAVLLKNHYERIINLKNIFKLIILTKKKKLTVENLRKVKFRFSELNG